VVLVDIKIQIKTKTDMLQEVLKTDLNSGQGLLKQWQNNGEIMKLTKKEKHFLIYWLEEDIELGLELESINKWGINKLKSIVRKLKEEK